MTLDVLDCIDELVDRITHREPYTLLHGTTLIHQWHTTTHPSLLEQLGAATKPNTTAEDGPRPAYASKPTARLEAIDALARIDHEAARWLRNLGHDDPGTTIDCIRRAHALTATERPCRLKPKQRYRTCCLRHDIDSDISRWWAWARIHTGWDTPPWRPANTCPLCGERGTLRIRLAHTTAVCIADQCWETWDSDTISLLANHIRAENLEGDTPAEAAC